MARALSADADIILFDEPTF
ncbi:hypothetical protein [Sodalis-like endosymbiont of Proechinophthirus fluctus]